MCNVFEDKIEKKEPVSIEIITEIPDFTLSSFLR